MRKKIIISIILCAIVLKIGIAQAVTGNANLKASNTNVKPGTTFTVTLSIECEDGINGIDTSYSYDKDKLELVSANVANSNWANLGLDNSITLISNTTSKITSNDVYVLTFKVNDSAQSGITKIDTNEIIVDSDLTENSSFTVSAKSVDINITSEGNSNNNTENNTDYVGDNITTENTNTDTNSNMISQNNTSTGNNTIANLKFPQAGVNSIVSIIALGTVAIAISIYLFAKIKSINKQ